MATAPTVVELGFWDTALGKAILRIVKLVLAALVAGLVSEIARGDIVVPYLSAPVVYFILSTLQDLFNQKVPNTAAALQTGDHLPPQN